jgi:hypothetical protein
METQKILNMMLDDGLWQLTSYCPAKKTRMNPSALFVADAWRLAE